MAALKKWYLATVVGVMGPAALAAPSALAQDASVAAQESAAFGDLIVTANRRDENLQDVAASVSALGADAIQERHIERMGDVANTVPGMKFGEFANSGNLSIRGVGTAFVSGGGESSAAVHIDGVFLPTTATYRMGTFDLQRVEVLKGPQGTLYGRNSTAGVVNFITQAPSSELEAGANFGIGNYSLRQGEAYISGPILGDSVRARLVLRGEDRDGYVENTLSGQDLDDMHASGGRLSIDADLTDWWTAKLRFTRSVEDTAGPAFDSFDGTFVVAGLPVSSVELDPYLLESPVIYDSGRDLTLVTLTNTFALAGNIDLVATTGYTDFEVHSFYDTLGSSVGYVPLESQSDTRAFSQELLLRATHGPVDWIVGAYGYERRIDRSNTTDQTTLGGPVNSAAYESGQDSWAVFADATLNITDRTRVFAGARYISESLFDRQTLRIDASPLPPACPAIGTARYRDETANTGRLGIQHDLTEDAMIYAQASRGYKAGGFAGSDCADAFEPETVNALELGYKSSWFGNSLRFNASVFYNDIENLQLEQATFAGIPVVNAPKSHSLGAEFSLAWLVTDRLSIDANLTLLESEYDEFAAGDVGLGPPFPPASLAGNPLNNAPDASGFLGIEYEIPFQNDHSLTLRGEAIATTDYQLREVIRPWTVQEGYVMTNFFATYRASDRLSISGWVKNAGDEPVLGGVLGFFGAMGTYGPPRTYGINIRLEY